MVNCCIIGCTKRTARDKGISFYRIPKVVTNQCSKTKELSERRRGLWLSRISRADLTFQNCDYLRVCSLHFIGGKPAGLFQHDSVDWVPSLQLGHTKVKVTSSAVSRQQRVQCRRAIKKEVQDKSAETLILEEMQEDVIEATTTEDATPETGVGCQTIMTTRMIQQLEDDCQALRTDAINNRFTMNTSRPTEFLEESLDGNNDKVRFYTGLPTFFILKKLFTCLVQEMGSRQSQTKFALTSFQEFMLVLMRLRLNLRMQDLAYRFKVSQPTVSRIFAKWIDIMYNTLQDLIVWPDRQTLHKTMPKCFKEAFDNSNIAVIIDCFEVFIDRPSSLGARATTWSQYKHNNTAKYLIGITPQGSVSYLSKGWGGRTSDKYITEHSGFLDNIKPGDIVMADRGFDIAETLGFVGARLLMPSFTRGKPQLSIADVEKSRKIASLRIHVERVIGLVRGKYDILNGTIPIDSVSSKPIPQLDQICRVCCMLTNLCPPVVPLE